MPLVGEPPIFLALLFLEESGGTPIEYVLAAAIVLAVSGLGLLALNKPN